jgi:hypothetical protein
VDQLPNKLSELAQMALDDVLAVERLPNQFVVDMGEFIVESGNLCRVCAAGAVMVQRLGATTNSTTNDFGPHNKWALWAIDKLRMGYVGWALQILKGDERVAWRREDTDHALDRDVPEYSTDSGEWHVAMRSLIADLQKAGL